MDSLKCLTLEAVGVISNELSVQEVNVAQRSILSPQESAWLRENLIQYFDGEEFRTLCYDLGVDYDDLKGEGKTAKARDLIVYLDHRGRISELIEKCIELRPQVDWRKATYVTPSEQLRSREMAKAEVMDLTVVCQSFPEPPKPSIHRENFLDTIDNIFESGTEVVVAEGEEGIGKTTLLAQFAARHPNHALSLFIRPARWAYDLEVLRFDLCSQVQWVLCQEELSAMPDLSDAFLRTSWTELRKRIRYRKETFYFVIDGLDEIPKEDAHIRKLVIDMLPFGLPGFCFLFAGAPETLSKYIPRETRLKPFPLSGFTLDQTMTYFKDCNIDRQSLEEIYQACRKIPGRFATARRILQSGTSVQALLKEPNLYEIEWRGINMDDARQINLLAVLAHGRKRFLVDDLARISNLESAAVQALIQGLSFISCDPESGEVSFVSEAFRKFAADQLHDLKDQVHDVLIDDLLRDPDSDASRLHLPIYLDQAGRYEDILKYLSPDHFPRMMEHIHSLGPVKQQAELGMNAALKLRRDGDLMRFSVQKSEMMELDGAKVWRSEIEARMALDDYESAIALAQSVVLTEERLHLLAIIAKEKRKQGMSPEPELLEQIHHLYSTIDPTTLGEQAVEMASDLLYVSPSLAIEMVEKATSTTTDESALDRALAKLSIAALSEDDEQYRTADTLESIRSRIRDPEVRSFTAAVSLLVGDCTAVEVIEQAKKLESADKRLFLLREWAMKNREREDAVEVVEYALRLVIETTPYSPNASVLRDIATPLPFVPDEPKAKQLVGRFDSQKGAVERFGPTEDYVRLQLLLARTESKYDFEAASNRLIDVYLYISDLSELAVKTGCMARLVSTLADVDPDMTLETKEDLCLHTLSRDDLQSDREQLLDATAEHYYATRSMVRALAKTKPELALELTTALNTEPRRDLALLALIESAVRVPADKLNLAFIDKAIECFANWNLRDEALFKIMARLSSFSEQSDDLAKASLRLVNRIKDIQDASQRCNACCLAYSFLVKQKADEYSGMLSHLLDLLSTAWESIDVGWCRVDVGFKIVRTLTEPSPDTARMYLEKIGEYREEILLDSHSTALTYLGCIRLAIRAYSGLLPKRVDASEDIESLARLIDRIPSDGERAGLWAELALRYYACRRPEDCTRIVTERVRPLLQNIAEGDKGYWTKAIIDTAPALYCAHKLTALETILGLPFHQRDAAYAGICEFTLRRKPLTDPYDTLSRQGYDITFGDVVDICELMSLMDNDGLIYHFVECVSNSVMPGRHGERFTRQEKPEIANRLEKVIIAKLPNQRYIKHDGYKIAALAHVARIRRGGPQKWLDLIESARRNVPNIADRALVLCIIAAAMPKKESSRPRRRQILEEAQELVKKIPTTLDKIQRYEDLARAAIRTESSISEECLRLAMKFATESDKPEMFPIQRRIIDLAYRFDDSLAASLASIADDDPARAMTRRNLRQRLQYLELKKKMANSSGSSLDAASSSKSEYSQAAWELLGSLNAGRIQPASSAYMRDGVRFASDLPFSQSYPILSWAIENAVGVSATSDQEGVQLRSIYEAMLLGAELAGRMASRSSKRAKLASCYTTRSSDRESIIIRAGERVKAIEFFRSWFERGVRDYLKICDPFFGPDDLEVLQLLQSVNPRCRVYILTSEQHHHEVSPPWRDAYRTHWRLEVSEQQDPPDTEVVIVGVKSGGEPPVHDRWWLTNGAGIRVGTSFESLGISKMSEISHLTEEEARVREEEVDRYLQHIEREHLGEKLQYTLFTLP